MLSRILHRPYRTITSRSDTRSYKLEVLLVGILGALAIPGWAWIAFNQLQAISDAGISNAQMGFTMTAQVIQPLIFIFGIWIWYTVASHFISRSFKGGRSSIGRMFRATAWTLVPIGIWNLLKSVVMLAYFWGYEFEAGLEGSTANEQVQNLLQSGLEPAIWGAVLLLGILFIVWSGYLLSLAIAELRDLSQREARITAIVPAGAYALFVFWNTLVRVGVV